MRVNAWARIRSNFGPRSRLPSQSHRAPAQENIGLERIKEMLLMKLPQRASVRCNVARLKVQSERARDRRSARFSIVLRRQGHKDLL
jgi:hypothetical protein